MNNAISRPRSVLFVLALFAATPTRAQALSPAQITQIEDIAQAIALQHNQNASAVDDMTVSSRATAIGRNVRFENTLRVIKKPPAAKLMKFSDQTQREVVSRSCIVNVGNPAFDGGLSYTFVYTNTFGEKLAEFNVDKSVCARYR